MREWLADSMTQPQVASETRRCVDLLQNISDGLPTAEEDIDWATRAAIRLVRNVDLDTAGTLVELSSKLSERLGPRYRSRHHALLSNLALRQAEYGVAAQEAVAGRDVALRAGLELEIGLCSMFAGSACQWSGQLSEAERWFDEALVSGRRSQDRSLEANALASKSILHRMRGEGVQAAKCIGGALEIFQGLGDMPRVARCLLTRGLLYLKQSSLEQAEADLRLAVTKLGELGQPRYQDSAKLALGRALMLTGRLESAEPMVSEVLQSAKSASDRRKLIIAQEYLGDIYSDQGRHSEALAVYRDAWKAALEVGEDSDLFLESAYRFALSSALNGVDVETAKELSASAVERARGYGDLFELAAALSARGRLLVCLGDLSRGADCLRSSVELGRAIGDANITAISALMLSRVASRLGEPVDAVGFVHEARRGFTQTNNPRWIAETDTWTRELLGSLAVTSSEMVAVPAPPPQTSKGRGKPSSPIPSFLTVDSFTRQQLGLALKIAPRSLSILVLGESGTGKEVVAEAIHAASARKGPFVPVNCGALPGDLLEAELFGAARGAYTGADRERGGLIEHSHRGTLFLDEIGDMPLKAQARLLRALERGEIRRLGEVTPRLVDLRIVAATHRNLLEMVSASEFRLDLYHRLTGYVLRLPPLRERAGDVLLLVDHFLKVFATEQDKDVRLSPDVRQELARHSWPGNVRQLRNVLHRIVSLAEPGQILARLPFELEGHEKPRSLPELMVAEEKRRILDALQSHNWNKAKAAIALGSSRTTLLGKMKRYGIDMDDPRARLR